MTTTYSPRPSTLTPVVLSDEVLLAMGRIVRAMAEIDDLVTLFLRKVSDVSEGKLMILLGQTPMSQKLRLSETFAKALGGRSKEAYDAFFGDTTFKALIDCRNVIAHGVLLGQTDDGQIAFLMKKPLDATPTSLHAEVTSFPPEAFAQFASIAEDVIPQIEEAGQFRLAREKRRTQSLGRHSKSQPKRPPSQ